MTKATNPPGYALLEHEVKAAEKVGRYVGRTWTTVDTEDIVSELYVWLLSNGRYVCRWRLEGVHGANKLRVALAREARKYARREHEARGGGPRNDSDRCTYDEAELEVLLSYLFDHADWAALGEAGTAAVPLEDLADVSGALHGMTGPDRQLLHSRFGEDRSLRDIGAELGCSEDAARMRVKRTVERLRARLAPTGDDRRTVQSNARAVAGTRSDR